ncbi:uroporphyrinogen-III synthase-like [Pollicipes pollicipes]|uniref:uroporphyrinogen-III synthase-like n=1 Tax=Pollicipes pollicipes TaxID=41117 RepID=UPI0018856D72|nr:uroporphyrinogen-III synthase-like [Pollicipes pollicipes]
MAWESRKKVVLLRSQESSSGQDRYTDMIQAAGYHVHNVPTLAFQYQNLDVLKKCLDSPTSFAGIVFTSPRAVLAASEANHGQKLDGAWFEKPCFVVGERTQSLAMESLGLCGIGAESGNAEKLADVIISQMAGECQPLLFPCGSLKKETLPNKLESAGIPLQCSTIYVTSEHPDMASELKKSLEMQPDFMVYFSPSGVLFSQDAIAQSEGLEEVKHVSIGPATKAALEKSGLSVFASAPKPCPESVVEILQS